MGQPRMGRHSLSLTRRTFWAKYPFGVPTSVGELACFHRLGVQSQLEMDLETDIILHEPTKLKIDE